MHSAAQQPRAFGRRHLWLIALLGSIGTVSACGDAEPSSSPSESTVADSASLESTVATTVSPTEPTTPTTTVGQPIWARIDLSSSALITDAGHSFELSAITLGGDVVERRPDGTVVVATPAGVHAFHQDSDELVELWPGSASRLVRGDSGAMYAMTDEGLVDLASGDLSAASGPVEPDRQSILAENGLAVEVVKGDYRLDSDGYVTEVIRPDALRLLVDGEQSTVWDLGGPAEHLVVLDDFTGRHILAHRRSSEPALPPAEHLVLDLFTGHVETFLAVPGTVALTVPDTTDPPSMMVFPSGSLFCESPSVVSLRAPSELSQAAIVAFDRAALAAQRCDESWLRRLAVTSRWSDQVFSQLGSALRSVPSTTKDGWRFGDLLATHVLISTDGAVSVNTSQSSFHLRITKLDGAIVLAGSVEQESARELRAAAEHQAAGSSVIDFALSTDGADLPDPLLHAVGEMIGTGFNASPVVEALVTPELLRVVSFNTSVIDGELTRPLLAEAGVRVESMVVPSEPSSAEVDAIEALQAFALGESLDPDLLWADTVTIGAGPNAGRAVPSDEISERANWLIENMPYFRASGEESFSALQPVGDPVVTVGPHTHCAGPPVPAPVELAGLRRISVQVDPAAIDSCLMWRTFDVFFDDSGRIAGATVDWWEP